MYSTDDETFMMLALQQARTALAQGDYPVGAALTLNGRLLATARNSLFSDARTTAHAEHNLLAEHSGLLRAAVLEAPDTRLELYSTLEPCLMCLGTAVLHRVNRIVVACPDPTGGTTGIEVSTLGSVYQRLWPEIQVGLCKEESCQLIIQFLQTRKFRRWAAMLQEFQTMQLAWS